MASIPLNISTFRLQFPAFANCPSYPDEKLQAYWCNAGAYISNRQGGAYCMGMRPNQQVLALNYMTAHLLAISDIIAKKGTPGIVTGATIDKISVTIEPPPQTNQWQYWLNQTPYGQELLALLQIAAAGGRYFNGAPVFTAFRS